MKISVREAARMLGVSEKTLYRWIERKKLPVHRINDEYRFNRAELLEWATAERVRVAVEAGPEPTGDTPPLLSEVLVAGGIHYAVPGATPEAVLRELVARMHLPDDVDRAYLCEMLLARETLGSTHARDGIAIPHVRSPVVLHGRASLTLCFPAQPIDFGAPDHPPVRALFLLVCPTTRVHLHLLARLGAALHDAELARAVCEQASADAILVDVRRVEAGFPESRRVGAAAH